MKIGSLVKLRRCSFQGKVGMITLVPRQSHLAKSNPELAIYLVLLDNNVQCFTGNQMVDIT